MKIEETCDLYIERYKRTRRFYVSVLSIVTPPLLLFVIMLALINVNGELITILSISCGAFVFFIWFMYKISLMYPLSDFFNGYCAYHRLSDGDYRCIWCGTFPYWETEGQTESNCKLRAKLQRRKH